MCQNALSLVTFFCFKKIVRKVQVQFRKRLFCTETLKMAVAFIDHLQVQWAPRQSGRRENRSSRNGRKTIESVNGEKVFSSWENAFARGVVVAVAATAGGWGEVRARLAGGAEVKEKWRWRPKKAVRRIVICENCLYFFWPGLLFRTPRWTSLPTAAPSPSPTGCWGRAGGSESREERWPWSTGIGKPSLYCFPSARTALLWSRSAEKRSSLMRALDPEVRIANILTALQVTWAEMGLVSLECHCVLKFLFNCTTVQQKPASKYSFWWII